MMFTTVTGTHTRTRAHTHTRTHTLSIMQHLVNTVLKTVCDVYIHLSITNTTLSECIYIYVCVCDGWFQQPLRAV